MPLSKRIDWTGEERPEDTERHIRRRVMRILPILLAAGVVGIVTVTSGCHSQAASDEPNDVNAALDKAVAAGADIRPTERPLVVRMLNLSEKDLITGLRTFAELSGGHYPTSLDTRSTLKQVEADRLRSSMPELSESRKKQMLQDIFFASAFYEKLRRENRKVQYHGDTVNKDDAEKVLISWSESKDRYKVVLGNLSMTTLSREQLTKLAQ
jgi:hypothetical protein